LEKTYDRLKSRIPIRIQRANSPTMDYEIGLPISDSHHGMRIGISSGPEGDDIASTGSTPYYDPEWDGMASTGSTPYYDPEWDGMASTGSTSYHSCRSDSLRDSSIGIDMTSNAEEREVISAHRRIDNVDDLEVERKETLQFNEKSSSNYEIGESSNDKHDNLEKEHIIDGLDRLAKDQLSHEDLLARWKKEGYAEPELTKAIGNILQEVMDTYEKKKDEQKKRLGIWARSVESLKGKVSAHRDYRELLENIDQRIKKIQAGETEISRAIDFATRFFKVETIMKQFDSELEYKSNFRSKAEFVINNGTKTLKNVKEIMEPAMMVPKDSMMRDETLKKVKEIMEQ
jgi:hypothetical protein